ncbi:inhibin beta chain [Diorhabda carinulata]|uniref:inhibin beta chain n=1 Tax=Diorhabda carinulata TaxID=1163345 RepID=UPI0025A0A613|nr:inhibin beta chain [Diorhabda carinulata]
MAVYKNYYNRKAHWTITVSCLYLLCSTISCTIVNAERLRHPHMKRSGEPSWSQLEKSRIEDSSKNSILNCPNCLFENELDREKKETDRLRLEAIKKQILQKLGLRQKPNVTHSLPKDVILETLYRAEDEENVFLRNFDREKFSTTSSRNNIMETVDVDDFYGRTSEIISFAEEGPKVNHNRLLEFRATIQESNQVGQEFQVRSATLWLKADVQHRYGTTSTNMCRTTDLFVFKVISRTLPESITLSSRDFDRLTSDPISIALEESHTGWQKVDLTEIVREWLAKSKDQKLKLFVDCSCCSNWHIHLFNNKNEKNRKTNINRPFLVIHTDPSTAKRVRRRAIDCAEDSGNTCCKQRFYVSFRALGWDDWVIAPQGYYANYCRGDCGHHRTPDTYVTYHTHVIEEVRKTQHLSGMTPCCAPLKFSSMSLIYYGPDSTIIKRDLPKMVVDECGCP